MACLSEEFIGCSFPDCYLDRMHVLSCEACFKRRASHVPNALERIDNEAFQLIIYCF
jgi:hypothetical protein